MCVHALYALSYTMAEPLRLPHIHLCVSSLPVVWIDCVQVVNAPTNNVLAVFFGKVFSDSNVGVRSADISGSLIVVQG